MILENRLDVPADPDAVFALINDVERVAGCLPGAVLDGREDDTYLGRVTVKVGPIKAAYAGRVRFTEVAPDERRLRLSARGADSFGNGDAEADVTVVVAATPDGSVLELHTDLIIRGKIAQFGKGAIAAVSARLLDQFGRNLVAQLDAAGTEQPVDAVTGAVTGATPSSGPTAPAAELDGLAMLLPPNAGRYAAAAAALAVAFLQGWLFGRVREQDRLIKELQRGR